MGRCFQFDKFRGEVIVCGAVPWERLLRAPRQWSGRDRIETTIWLQHNHIRVSEAIAQSAAFAVAYDHPYHPVVNYLIGLVANPQSGEDFGTWLITYCGADDTPYVRAAGRKWLISCIARIDTPGCQVDSCYRVRDRELVIVDSETEIVRSIFRRYAELGSVRLLKAELDAHDVNSKSWKSAAGRVIGGKPFSRGALYLMLRNRTYRGEIVHKGQSHPGEHMRIIDPSRWDPVQMRLAGNTAERNSGTGTHQPSLLAGMLFDAEGTRMTPSYAVKKGTRYRYYVSRPLITKDQTKRSTGLRIPAAEVEQLMTSRVRQWLLDPGNIYQATRLPDLSAQRRLIARAGEIGKSWTQLPGIRQRAVLTTLIDRIDVGADQIDIHLHPTRLGALLDVAATPPQSATNEEIQILYIRVRLRRSGRAITMLIAGIDPFAVGKHDARLVKLLIRARQFNATLLDGDGVPFAALAKRQRVSPFYFTRLVRLSDCTRLGSLGRDGGYPIGTPESLEIGNEVFFEIVGHSFQYRAAARQISGFSRRASDASLRWQRVR